MTSVSPFVLTVDCEGDKQGHEIREGLPSFLVSLGDLKLGYESLECRTAERETGDKGDFTAW